MSKDGMVKGLVISNTESDVKGPCSTCQEANMRKAPVPKLTKSRASAPNMRVFTDTTGIIKDVDGKALKMFGDTTVFQFFVDDATRRTKVYPMKRKTDDEYLSALKRYITEVGQPVVILRSDGAAEFASSECQKFYEEHRIKREITPADTPQYNGVVERGIQTIYKMARAMRLEAQLPLHLAPFAVQYAVCLYNCLPHKALKGRTPEEAWSGEIPDLSSFRIFGSKVWVMSTVKHLAKFDNRSRVGIFLGFPKQHKGYLCYFPDTNRVVVTHQPVFDEGCFPFASPTLQDQFLNKEESLEFEDGDSDVIETPQLRAYDLEMLQELRDLETIPKEPDLENIEPWDDDKHEPGDDDLIPEQSVEVSDGPKRTRSGRVSVPPQPYWITSPSALAINLAAVESVIKAKKVFEPKTYKEAMDCADAEEWKESI